jgi:zinc transporter 2
MGGLSKEKRLTLAICLSSTFLVIEVIGGIWSNSLAILTDASHLLTDIAGFAIALLATIVAKRAADEKYTYGLVRAEVIGALLSVLTLWIITAVLLYEAYYRAMDWFNGSPSIVNGKLMSAVAIFGIFVNICLAVVFHEDHGGAFHSHDHGHAEGHGHDHGHSSSSGHEEKTITKGGYGSLDSAERGHAHDSDHEHGWYVLFLHIRLISP